MREVIEFVESDGYLEFAELVSKHLREANPPPSR